MLKMVGIPHNILSVHERERERERVFGTICFRGRAQLNSGLGRKLS